MSEIEGTSMSEPKTQTDGELNSTNTGEATSSQPEIISSKMDRSSVPLSTNVEEENDPMDYEMIRGQEERSVDQAEPAVHEESDPECAMDTGNPSTASESVISNVAYSAEEEPVPAVSEVSESSPVEAMDVDEVVPAISGMDPLPPTTNEGLELESKLPTGEESDWTSVARTGHLDEGETTMPASNNQSHDVSSPSFLGVIELAPPGDTETSSNTMGLAPDAGESLTAGTNVASGNPRVVADAAIDTDGDSPTCEDISTSKSEPAAGKLLHAPCEDKPAADTLLDSNPCAGGTASPDGGEPDSSESAPLYGSDTHSEVAAATSIDESVTAGEQERSQVQAGSNVVVDHSGSDNRDSFHLSVGRVSEPVATPSAVSEQGQSPGDKSVQGNIDMDNSADATGTCPPGPVEKSRDDKELGSDTSPSQETACPPGPVVEKSYDGEELDSDTSPSQVTDALVVEKSHDAGVGSIPSQVADTADANPQDEKMSHVVSEELHSDAVQVDDGVTSADKGSHTTTPAAAGEKSPECVPYTEAVQDGGKVVDTGNQSSDLIYVHASALESEEKSPEGGVALDSVQEAAGPPVGMPVVLSKGEVGVSSVSSSSKEELKELESSDGKPTPEGGKQAAATTNSLASILLVATSSHLPSADSAPQSSDSTSLSTSLVPKTLNQTSILSNSATLTSLAMPAFTAVAPTVLTATTPIIATATAIPPQAKKLSAGLSSNLAALFPTHTGKFARTVSVTVPITSTPAQVVASRLTMLTPGAKTSTTMASSVPSTSAALTVSGVSPSQNIPISSDLSASVSNTVSVIAHVPVLKGAPKPSLVGNVLREQERIAAMHASKLKVNQAEMLHVPSEIQQVEPKEVGVKKTAQVFTMDISQFTIPKIMGMQMVPPPQKFAGVKGKVGGHGLRGEEPLTIMKMLNTPTTAVSAVTAASLPAVGQTQGTFNHVGLVLVQLSS